MRLDRLFNHPVSSFPHLLREDNMLGGDLLLWAPVRLSGLMLLLLMSAEDAWAEPDGGEVLGPHRMDAS